MKYVFPFRPGHDHVNHKSQLILGSNQISASSAALDLASLPQTSPRSSRTSEWRTMFGGMVGDPQMQQTASPSISPLSLKAFKRPQFPEEHVATQFQICRYFQQGFCSRGERCNFAHVPVGGYPRGFLPAQNFYSSAAAAPNVAAAADLAAANVSAATMNYNPFPNYSGLVNMAELSGMGSGIPATMSNAPGLYGSATSFACDMGGFDPMLAKFGYRRRPQTSTEDAEFCTSRLYPKALTCVGHGTD